MPHASLNSSFGMLTVFEERGELTALEWSRALEGATTALLEEAVAQLEAYFDGRLREFSLPLHEDGSAFQHRVRARLREIRYGEVQTYGALAVALGTSPRAAARWRSLSEHRHARRREAARPIRCRSSYLAIEWSPPMAGLAATPAAMARRPNRRCFGSRGFR